MAQDHWFRRRSWTPDVQAEFERRLARARPGNRGRYVFVQGYSLREAARASPERAAELLPLAIALFDRVVRASPGDLRASSAHELKGLSLETLGDPHGALESLRLAVEQLRRRPSMENSCWLEYAFLAARQGLSEHYDEALSLLDEFAKETLPFPISNSRSTRASR